MLSEGGGGESGEMIPIPGKRMVGGEGHEGGVDGTIAPIWAYW